MPFNQKEYMRKYTEDHRERLTAYKAKYNRETTKSLNLEYLGVCTCPRCGKRGYKRMRQQMNKKTGVYHPPFVVVIHQHSERGHTVYDGMCYLGPVRVAQTAQKVKFVCCGFEQTKSIKAILPYILSMSWNEIVLNKGIISRALKPEPRNFYETEILPETELHCEKCGKTLKAGDMVMSHGNGQNYYCPSCYKSLWRQLFRAIRITDPNKAQVAGNSHTKKNPHAPTSTVRYRV